MDLIRRLRVNVVQQLRTDTRATLINVCITHTRILRWIMPSTGVF